MKTTVILDDELHAFLMEEAKSRHGSVRKLSALLNELVRAYFLKKKDLFGTTKRFDIKDARDESDRFD